MKLNRVMIAAPKSGSGKTTITCALLQTLKDLGYSVVSYKCGPDYIDPMFHQKIINIPAKNLDTFFTGEEETKKLFLNGRKEDEFAVMEGVMGLFDGLGGIREEGSSYHLAKVTNTPIILVVDAKGMGRSILPMIAGFLAYDTSRLIQGIILNRMSKSYYEIIKPLIEEELKIPVVGYFPDHKNFTLESRHLGLTLPNEVFGLKEKLKELSIEFQKTISTDKIIELAENAEEITAIQDAGSKKEAGCILPETDSPVIAVAKDEAFCFYYEDNLRLLREYGARLVEFSPLHDKSLPENCTGILLGGGYPELYAKELSQNTQMLSAIKKAMEKDIPMIAECGGFMYLHSILTDKEGSAHNMSGVLSSKCCYAGKLVRFGYIEINENQENFLPKGEFIRGHEFHYFDSERNGEDCIATKPVSGRNYPCVISGKNYWLGFPHLYYPSNPHFAESFVKKVKEYNMEKKQNGNITSLF